MAYNYGGQTKVSSYEHGFQNVAPKLTNFQKRKVSEYGDYVDTSKPTAFFQPTEGRSWTVSIAVPGSIIAL